MGRHPSAPEKVRFCPKHGLGIHRLHRNGFTADWIPRKDWRCLKCLRARYKPKDKS